MHKSYLPGGDTDFDAWVANYTAYAGAHADEIGLTADDLASLNTAHIQWSTDFVANNAAQAAVSQTVASKNTSRKTLTGIIRGQVQRVQAFPTTTDTNRQGLGITVPETVPSETELPQDERPTAHIDFSAPLEHVVLVRTKTASGERRGRPAGAVGCEIYRKVGVQPQGPAEMELAVMTTTNSVKLQYPADDGGKKVYYMMRYVSRSGEKGPWSAIESATLAAA